MDHKYGTKLEVMRMDGCLFLYCSSWQYVKVLSQSGKYDEQPRHSQGLSCTHPESVQMGIV